MAIYHLSAKVVSRSAGHSSVHAAAYRARCSLEDERTGTVHDYSRKSGDVLFAGVYAPKDAPDWAQDRAQLWNHVEAFEKRRDAQLARHFDIALMSELSVEQNRYALQDWVRENFTRKGLIADAVIHAPDREGDPRNIHAHVMVVTRKLDGSEFAARKERTADIAERKAELENLRESWERIGNRHLERHGHEPTLDRRSLLAQGSDREPTVHLGKEATALERQGQATELGDVNRAIANDNERRLIDLAAERAAREAVEREKHGRGVAAAGQGISPSEGAQPAPEIRPLGKTAGDIRLAWRLTQGGAQFAEAIEERGLILVHVSRADVEASQRASALAEAIGRQNQVLREGFAVVDRGGYVTPVNQRTTGDLGAEIDKRLGGLDTRELLSVGEARAVMAEANRAEWRNARQAERDAQRPASGIETAIGAAYRGSRDGESFTAALDNAGLAVVRATGADVRALEALRKEEGFARQSGVPHKPRHFGRVAEGDLAAVNRQGDVYRLNPQRLDFPGIEGRLGAGGARLASVTEARAGFEIAREERAEFFALRRANRTATRIGQSEAKDALQRFHGATGKIARDVGEARTASDKAIDKGAKSLWRTAGKLFDVVANAVENLFSPPPPPTPEQQKRDHEAAKDQHAAFRQFVEEQTKTRFIVEEHDRHRRQEQELQEQQEREARRSRDERQR